jgi:membrane-associated phospholipid phosphatase
VDRLLARPGFRPLAGSVVAAACFALLAWMARAHWGLARFDDDALAFSVEHRSSWLTSSFRVVTTLGSVPVLIGVVAVGSGWLLWRRREWLGVVTVILVFTATSQSKNLMKSILATPRPPASVRLAEVSGYAFPSGHAADAFAVWVMLAMVMFAGRSRRVVLSALSVAVAISLLVGETRLYLGVHWLTDVLGGFALAAFWVALGTAALVAVRTKVRPRAGPVRT